MRGQWIGQFLEGFFITDDFNLLIFNAITKCLYRNIHCGMIFRMSFNWAYYGRSYSHDQLLWAVARGDLSEVDCILSHPVRYSPYILNPPGMFLTDQEKGDSAFGAAVLEKQVAIAELVLRKNLGVDVNQVMWDHKTTLDFAVQRNDYPMVKLLFQKGANFCPNDSYGIIRALTSTLEIAKTFFEKGCDVNVKEPYEGNTALHLAVKLGNAQIVEWLLSVGADSTILNREQKIPLQLVDSHPESPVRHVFARHQVEMIQRIPLPRDLAELTSDFLLGEPCKRN